MDRIEAEETGEEEAYLDLALLTELGDRMINTPCSFVALWYVTQDVVPFPLYVLQPLQQNPIVPFVPAFDRPFSFLLHSSFVLYIPFLRAAEPIHNRSLSPSHRVSPIQARPLKPLPVCLPPPLLSLQTTTSRPCSPFLRSPPLFPPKSQSYSLSPLCSRHSPRRPPAGSSQRSVMASRSERANFLATRLSSYFFLADPASRWASCACVVHP
jgi:hypothetical protein